MQQAISIGKFTLESITAGMYISPMVLYREYIQNSVDSIDQAVAKGIIKHEQGKIVLSIDTDKKQIMIEDNGIGVPHKQAFKVLTDIGNSSKVFSTSRGFRGIGRLAGLSYSDKLTFVTSFKGERHRTITSFDCVKLKELLIPGNYEEYDLLRVLSEITENKQEIESVNTHYFKVILDGVQDVDGILDSEEVKDYISQVAPLPFDETDFQCASKVEDELKNLDITIPHYKILINNDGEEEQLFKLNSDRFLSDRSKKIIDKIKEIRAVGIYDKNERLQAVMWYSISNFLGTILDESKKGIRLRKGNILIGDKGTLNNMFREDRFNGWFQGEVHVIDKDIIPNARRDDFERNEAYLSLLSRLKTVGNELSKTIRDASILRNEKEATSIDKNSDLKTNHTTNNTNRSSNEKQSTDVFKKLNILNQEVKHTTNYNVLNISNNISVREKKFLEEVFEVLMEQCTKKEGTRLINKILEKVL